MLPRFVGWSVGPTNSSPTNQNKLVGRLFTKKHWSIKQHVALMLLLLLLLVVLVVQVLWCCWWLVVLVMLVWHHDG